MAVTNEQFTNEQLREKIETLHTVVTEGFALCVASRQELSDLDVAVHGPPSNGRNPGLVTRMALCEEFQSGLRWRSRLLLGTAVAATLALLADIVVTVFVRP